MSKYDSCWYFGFQWVTLWRSDFFDAQCSLYTHYNLNVTMIINLCNLPLSVSRCHKTRPRCARTSTSARVAAATCRPQSSSSRPTPPVSGGAGAVPSWTTTRAPARTTASTASCSRGCASRRRAWATDQGSLSSFRWVGSCFERNMSYIKDPFFKLNT